MAIREKVKLENITDDDKTKVSFKKREGGFMKNEAKEEPSILGGVHEEEGFMKKWSYEDYEEEISHLTINADPTMVSDHAFHFMMRVDHNLIGMDGRVMGAYGKEDDEVYIPAPPMSEEGLLINNGGNDVKLDGQILNHGMNFEMESLEYYMGFGSSEMLQPFDNTIYQYASSSNNLFLLSLS
ncbi:uncharacterized protein G2W53_025847 [Senna tora]|uniref:Uncharacterized protein n=1 Tax=Senna tora TaxID=362788 RepID=A0A834TE00_9FABA|nr:uncharacterized protein G2W53_025847 [Senna tora]